MTDRDEGAVERRARRIYQRRWQKGLRDMGAGDWEAMPEPARESYRCLIRECDDALAAGPLPRAVLRRAISELRDEQQTLLSSGGKYDWALYACEVEGRIKWLDAKLTELDAGDHR